MKGGWYTEALRLFFLADKLDVDELCEQILTSLNAEMAEDGGLPTQADTIYVYGKSTAEAPIRSLFTTWWTLNIDLEIFERPKYKEWLAGQPDLARDLFHKLCETVKPLSTAERINLNLYGRGRVFARDAFSIQIPPIRDNPCLERMEPDDSPI